MKFAINGVIDSNALLTKIVNGLIPVSVKVAIGAKEDKTINPKASAPPKSPNLQRIRAKGVTISAKPTPNNASIRLGSKNIKTTEIEPKIIHIKSDISLFLMSMIVAELNMVKAKRILIKERSSSIMV